MGRGGVPRSGGGGVHGAGSSRARERPGGRPRTRFTTRPIRVETRSMSLNDLREIARRIERAEAEQLARTGDPGTGGAIEVAGGLAVSKGPGSPFSAALCVGLAGAVTPAELDRIEAHLGGGGGA